MGWASGVLLVSVAARVDQAVLAFFVAHRQEWCTIVMRGVTDLGSSAVLIAVAVGAGPLWHRRTRTWRPLWLLVGAYGGAWLLQRTIKLVTHRPRPPAALALDVFGGYAFPSGHATDAAAVYGMLAVLLVAIVPRRSAKLAVWAAAIVVVGLVGLTRIYLGGHWLTDVLAGFALGTAWLWCLLTVTRAPEALRLDPQPEPQHPSPNPPNVGAGPG